MLAESIQQTYRHYRTLQTNRISVLPIVILMPHSACNCKCVMCDIWKGNRNLKQLTEKDIESLLTTLQKFGTGQVLMSGGEALLNPNFFRFCALLRNKDIRVTVLSTGLTLAHNAEKLIKYTNDVIISLDGDEPLHDKIRNIPGAFNKLTQGIQSLKTKDPSFHVAGRTVIHKLNFRKWPDIIEAAKKIGLDQISFLPADISSHAFNRAITWDNIRQNEILPSEKELAEMQEIIHSITSQYSGLIKSRFIAESVEKIQKIHDYYTALYGRNDFPFKKCNAPWVSTVVEADGNVRPCFFHDPIGNIHDESLDKILNSNRAIQFRKNLDMDKNDTCLRCVCYLNLKPKFDLFK